MDFLNHGEVSKVLCWVFLLSPLQCTEELLNHKRLHEFEEIGRGKAGVVTVNSKEENS
jgi:hypothetical protein